MSIFNTVTFKLPSAQFPLPNPSTSGIPPLTTTSVPSGSQLASSQSLPVQSHLLSRNPSLQTPPTSGSSQSSLQPQPTSGIALSSLESLEVQPKGETPLSSCSTSVRLLLSELGRLAPEGMICLPRSQEDSSQVSMGHFVSSISTMEELSRCCPIPSGDVPSDVVIKAFLQKNTLDINNVGRLGVLLARYTYFGDKLLHDCTLKGKGKRPGLDPNKLESLILAIHNTHPFSLLNVSDFRKKVQPKIQRSLTDFLKPKSKKPT